MFFTLTPQAILFFTLCGILLYLLTRFFPEIREFYHNRVKWQTNISREQYYRYDKILSAYLPYYRRLSIEGKARFIHRLIETMAEKEFVGRNKLEVTEEMRVVVCGAMVQVTFGLKKFKLAHFNRILLYPDKFYNSLLETHLKGGASPSGVLMLSWSDVVEGFSDENDTYNLALHEMGHALKLDVTEGEDFDVLFSSYLDEWMNIGVNVMHRMRLINDVKLREYAKTNIDEFFAVCIENFFETPVLMKQNLPNIYNHLCVLLNQVPSNFAGDYELPENFAENTYNKAGIIPVPSRIPINFSYQMWHWTFNIIITGLFIMIPLSFYIDDTVIDGYGWKGIYMISLLTCIAAQSRLLYKRDSVSFPHLSIYSLFGISPLMMFFFYFINDSTKIPDQAEKYRIVNYINNNTEKECIVELENHILENNESIRKTDRLVTDLREVPLSYIVEYDCGILGYRIIKNKQLILTH